MAGTVVFRGKAAVEGTPVTFDALLYNIAQSAKSTQNFDMEEIKDGHGYDVAWLMRNEHSTFDASLKLVADTAAHSIIPATAVSTTSAVSSLGQPFLAPGSTITLSGFTVVGLNGLYQVLSGGDIDLGNAKVADLNIKLRKYANATQNSTSEGGYGYIPT